MTKAALLSAATALLSMSLLIPGAEARRVRVGFGFPIGVLALQPGYGQPRAYRYTESCCEPRTQRKQKSARRATAKTKTATPSKKQESPQQTAATPATATQSTAPTSSAVASATGAGGSAITPTNAASPATTAARPVTKTPGGTQTPATSAAQPGTNTVQLDCQKYFPSVGLTMPVPCTE